MRPAQKAPENRLSGVPGLDQIADASMRPAQKAPENSGSGVEAFQNPPASMRPAQKAPENGIPSRRSSPAGSSFNEAGAKSAGKRPLVD